MGMAEWAKALRQTQDTIPTIRTGTVLTDYANPNTSMYVSLDNDPTSTPVRAVGGEYLGTGTRVMLVSYPPRGLAVIEVLQPRAVQGGTWQFITTGVSTFTEAMVPAGARGVRFLLQGGGGGSGGTATIAANQVSASGGGAGGDCIDVSIYFDGLQWPMNYTVGGGGAGGAAGNTVGGTGGTTQLVFTRYGVTTTLSAVGGLGGNGGGSTATPFQVMGGNFSGNISGLSPALGAILIPGRPGFPGIILPGATPFSGWGGDGGESHLGARQLSNVATRQLNVVGVPAGGHRYGGGASGGFAVAGQAQTAGQGGGAGVIAWQPIF